MIDGLEQQLAQLSPAQRLLLEARLEEKRNGRAPAGAAPASMADSPDDENLLLVDTSAGVEGLLSRFYGRYPWPWPAKKFDYLEDSGFEIAMVNQDIGDWSHQTLPAAPRIWVAGCGVNQALITALRFRRAQVVGSDISEKSLSLCADMAAQMGIKNLELRDESINNVAYRDEFDYVICTGVIHHNAEPAITLARLAAAMKPGGVLELMVYNRFHRIITSAFQKAVRCFGRAGQDVDFEAEVELAQRIVADLPVRSVLEKAFIQYMEWSESDFADLLVQPVEHSYTVESLASLMAECGLEMALPCISNYAKHLARTVSWNLEFNDPVLAQRYLALDDAARWQVTNLLLHDKSPLLWFYARRSGQAPRRTEREVCEDLLNRCCEPCATQQRSFLRDEETGAYRLLPEAVAYPLAAPDPRVRDVAEAARGDLSLREVLAEVGIEASFANVNRIRTLLTTSAFPYLRVKA